MPANRNALIRYRTIDNCLRNRFRKWTLEDLINACSDALYEYEGIDKGVSKRTVQADIQIMRSDKLGYNAPIIVEDRCYYTYEDKEYSITNIPLTDQDLTKLTEVVEILKQFKGFSHFQDVGGMVQKLEDKIQSAKQKTQPIIDFEKNENLTGLEHLAIIYQFIVKKKAMKVCYQSFKARTPNDIDFHPYLLKEYRNRWFVLGRKSAVESLLTLALDRIKTIEESTESYINDENFDASTYYKDVVGVTVNKGERVTNVHIAVDRYNAPYVITKPLHRSQEILSQDNNGIVIKIQVKLNFELERLILGFGEGMQVLKPIRLRKRMAKKLSIAVDRYQEETK